MKYILGTVHVPNSLLYARDASTAPISHETPTLALTPHMCWSLIGCWMNWEGPY